MNSNLPNLGDSYPSPFVNAATFPILPSNMTVTINVTYLSIPRTATINGRNLEHKEKVNWAKEGF